MCKLNSNSMAVMVILGLANCGVLILPHGHAMPAACQWLVTESDGPMIRCTQQCGATIWVMFCVGTLFSRWQCLAHLCNDATGCGAPAPDLMGASTQSIAHLLPLASSNRNCKCGLFKHILIHFKCLAPCYLHCGFLHDQQSIGAPVRLTLESCTPPRVTT